VDNKSDLNVYTDVTPSADEEKKSTCCGSSCRTEVTAGDPMSKFKDIDFNEWAGPWQPQGEALPSFAADRLVGSYQVYALKPST
jgi:hypothetical protein